MTVASLRQHARRRFAASGVLLGLGLVLLLGVLILGPLLKIAYATVARDGFDVWRQVLDSRLSPNLTWKPLFNTLVVGVGVGVGTVVIGGFLAWIVVLTDVPGRRIIGMLATLPYMIPSFATALAWGVLFRNDRVGGSGGFFHGLGWNVPDWLAWGMVPILVVLIAHYYSLAFTLTAAALASINADLLEAGQMTGASRRKIVVGIAIPVVLPAVVAGASLTFAGGISNFAAPALLGLPVRLQTLATRLYGMIEVGQVERGYALALLLIAVSAVFLWAGNRMVAGRKSYATITGKGGRVKRFALGTWRWPLFALAALICLFTTVVPVLVLIASSLTVEKGALFSGYSLHYWIGSPNPSIAQGQPGIFHNDVFIGATLTTIGLGLAVAVVATLLGLAIAYYVSRHGKGWLAGIVAQISFLPMLVPGIAFGAAYIALFGSPIGPLPALYGTFTILVVAGAAYLVPFAAQSGRSVMSQVSGDLEEAARLAGASLPRRLFAIFVPLTLRGLTAGALIVFVKIVRDLSLVVLLFTPATPLLSVVAYRYASEGFLQFANAITVVILAISIAATLLAHRLQNRTQPWMKND